MFADWRQFAYPPLARTVGRFVMPQPAVPDDVAVSLDLILEYDGCDRPDAVDAATLVIAGDRDPYFTEPVLHETAAGIADARLSLLSGAKHAAFHERKATFDRRVTQFLAGESE
jgi:pimeloyl-ACP methyl ester carboxylesterase